MTRRKSKSKKNWCNNGPAAPLDKKKGSSPPLPPEGATQQRFIGKPRPEVQPSLLLYIPFIDRKSTPFICTCGIELKIVPLSLWSSWQQLFSSYYGEFDAVIRCVGLYFFRETSRHPGYPFIHLNDLTKFLPVYRREAWLKEPLFGRRLPVSVSIR